MKKRLAKKALSEKYFNVWVNPRNGKRIYVPRNGKCWCIMQKAFIYYGRSELIEEIISSILNDMEKEQ